MKKVCVIPARYASTRFPAKPLADLCGTPLVVHVFRKAVESAAFDDVIVATDDKRIVEVVKSHGGEAIVTSEKHNSGTDRVFEIVQNGEWDFAVNLQGDEPLISPDFLKEFASKLDLIDDETILTAVSLAEKKDMDDPNAVKAVLSTSNHALYFSRSPIPFDRNNSGNRGYKHTGIYGFTQNSLKRFCNLTPSSLEIIEKLEQLRALENGMKILCHISSYSSIGVDTPQDLAMVANLIGHNNG